MSKMTRHLLTLLFVLFLFSGVSIGQEKEDRTLEDNFDQVKISDGVDLYLSQGTTVRLMVEAHSDYIDEIKTYVQGEILVIEFDDKPIRWLRGWSSRKLVVHLTVPDLRALYANGGSDVNSTGKLNFRDFRIQARGGSDVDLDLVSGSLICQTSGGSDLSLSGSSDYFEVEASGGSDVEAKSFQVKNCKLNVSGGSDAKVHVTGELWMNASGASDIYYSGNPKITYQKATSGSDIHG